MEERKIITIWGDFQGLTGVGREGSRKNWTFRVMSSQGIYIVRFDIGGDEGKEGVKKLDIWGDVIYG